MNLNKWCWVMPPLFFMQNVSWENAIIHIKKFPLASATMTKSAHMDDSCERQPNSNPAASKAADLWLRAGMKARKWLSNKSEVLSVIPTKSTSLWDWFHGWFTYNKDPWSSLASRGRHSDFSRCSPSKARSLDCLICWVLLVWLLCVQNLSCKTCGWKV